MENKENLTSVSSEELNRLREIELNVKKKKTQTLAMQKCRAKKKEKRRNVSRRKGF